MMQFKVYKGGKLVCTLKQAGKNQEQFVKTINELMDAGYTVKTVDDLTLIEHVTLVYR
jgi:hypothetical protein